MTLLAQKFHAGAPLLHMASWMGWSLEHHRPRPIMPVALAGLGGLVQDRIKVFSLEMHVGPRLDVAHKVSCNNTVAHATPLYRG